MLVGCGRARVGVQVSKREFHTRIHLDYVRVKFLSCIKKIKKKLILHSLTFMVDPTVNVRAKSTNIIITPNAHTFGGI